MTQIDWGKEQARLEALYAAMSEGELQEVADDADSLTEAARAALGREMLRRRMEAPPERKPSASGEITDSQKIPKPVMVGRYTDVAAAAVAKSVLDSAGIESFLSDENMIQLNNLISIALGGVKLFVRDEDSVEARELLEAEVPGKSDVEEMGE